MSNIDIAIKENIEKEKTCETFFNQVVIMHDNLDEVEDDFYEIELYKACHIWQGYKDKDGYGRFALYSKSLNYPCPVLAHRFAYAYEFGADKLPIGLEKGNNRLVINHICHNRACVNPYHLEIITQIQNISPEKRKPKDA